MTATSYEYFDGGCVGIKAWTKGVPVEEQAMAQLRNVASLSFIHSHIAVMPDVHWGRGATVGSVIPCYKAIIPAAVGVDIGCGMMAIQTSIRAEHLPDNLALLRSDIEAAIPHGRTADGDAANDRGAWSDVPEGVVGVWRAETTGLSLVDRLAMITQKHPKIARANSLNHLGTLGTGNHFIEICLDEDGFVWVMLHSGSRGVGNRIGTYFIELAKKEMERWFINLPDKDLAYLAEGSDHFYDYVKAVNWAQDFALMNRRVMMGRVLDVLKTHFPDLQTAHVAVNCHHNYVAKEKHFGEQVWVTRKGAVKAGVGDLGIIPGSMGERSFIVRGKGNRDSFNSCSHGAGRAMSRTEARKRFSIADHELTTAGVECRKDEGVIDETPGAYKDINAVMAAQSDLVDIVATLKQVVCVKS